MYPSRVKIRNVVHRGLRHFIERNNPKGLPTAAVERIRNIITFLQEMDGVEELNTIPSWKAHQLSGNRKGTWSLTITRNWRITFKINQAEKEIVDLDYEDYH